MARRKAAREDLSRGALSTVAPQPEAPSTSYYTYGAIPSATVAADPEEERRRIAEQQEQVRRAEEARVAEQQRQQQLVEMQRQQALAAQQAEAARLAEVARQQEAARVAAQRAEAERVAAQRAEAERAAAQRAEAERAAAQRAAAERAAAQRAEAQRVAAQKAEAARLAAEQRRQADAARKAEEARQAQIARQAELDRLAQQEAARVAAEQEAARVAAEQAARVQEPVGALTPVATPEPVGPSPLSVAEAPATPPVVTPEPTSNIFVEGATTPESTGLNMGALDELFANLRKNQELQKLALEPGLLQQGFTGTSGVTTPPSGAGIQATPTRAEEPAIDFEVTPEMAGALQEVAKPAAITDAEREAVTSNPRVQALQRISDQLKANDFAGAFDTALAAERELGGDFVGNIVESNKLRELRGPMTADEIAKFYNEMPAQVFADRYLGPGNEFSKEQAIERNVAALGGQAGYVDPMLGVKKEETLLSKLPVKELAALAAAAMGATAIPGLLGGAGGGAGAGGAGAAGGAAGGAGAAGAGAGALTGVVPTGLIPGAVSAAGLGTATFPIIASGGLTAAQAAALGLGAAGAAGAAASGGAGASPTTPTTPTEPGPLEEVVVTGTKAPVAPIVPPVVPPPTTPVTPPEAPPQLETPPEVAEQPPEEGGPLDEVVVTAPPTPAPPVVPPPIIIGTPVSVSPPEAPPEFETPPEEPPEVEGPLDEVTVTTTNPPPPDLNLPPIVPPLSTPVTPPETPPEFETPPEEPPEGEGPLDEVTVTTSPPPPPPDLNLPPIVLPPTTPVDLPKEPPEFETPPEKEDPLKSLLEKYANLENLLKLLGALGAAGTKTPTTPTTKPTTPSLGGALPKYTYTRQQLRPDIDYYTYGTRPEAKFFEDSMQLAQPAQPPLEQGPPAQPPGEDKPMATGGLTGYAKGGSNESRYFDGPGSGRDDKIPALLSDGEYVMDAETLALLGDGSTKEGARRMDQFRANIRKHKGRALSRGQISPDAKSPNKYMGGGLS